MAKVGMISITDDTGLRVIANSIGCVKKGIRQGLLQTAPVIVEEVRRGILDPPKTGRVYNYGGQLHQASAPGEYPAELTGALRMGVKSKVVGSSELIVGDKTSYGKDLEEGTDKIKPRPHLSTGA